MLKMILLFFYELRSGLKTTPHILHVHMVKAAASQWSATLTHPHAHSWENFMEPCLRLRWQTSSSRDLTTF